MKRKHFLLIICYLLTIFRLEAQNINPGKVGENVPKTVKTNSINLNGSIWAGYTTNRINNTGTGILWVPAVVYGGNISYSLWHRLSTGICINGFDNKFSSTWSGIHEVQQMIYLQGYYGGVFLEPRLFLKYPVHLSFPVTIGGGNIASHYYNTYQDGHGSSKSHTKDNSSFFIFEPGAEVELNLLKFMRLGIGARYRITTDINLNSLWYNSQKIYKTNVLNGLTLNLSLKFGRF